MNTEELYKSRINSAIDFIEANLTEKITIEDISRAAFFSAFHFHRIFKAFTGESLYAYVTRLRAEKAASILLEQNKSITETAFSVGFEDSATFARAFTKRFGCSATSWLKARKSKINQAWNGSISYTDTTMKGDSLNVFPEEIVFTKFTDENFVYVRNTGPFAGDYTIFENLHHQLLLELENKSIRWKKDKGFFAIYHDSMGITDDKKLRLSYGVVTESKTTPDGATGSFTLKANTYLIARFLLRNNEYGSAWSAMYRTIIPSYNMEPVDGNCFENYYENCYNSKTNKTEVRIGVPVGKIKE